MKITVVICCYLGYVALCLVSFCHCIKSMHTCVISYSYTLFMSSTLCMTHILDIWFQPKADQHFSGWGGGLAQMLTD